MSSEAKLLANLTARVVAAFVSNHVVPANDLPDLVRSVHSALSRLSGPVEPATAAAPAPVPAVPIRKSVHPDFIICLEDGKKMKMLKRHLANRYNMTPEQYRARWNLPADYPMVAPAYAEKRRELAKAIGLGRKPGTKVVKPVAKRGRKPAKPEAAQP